MDSNFRKNDGRQNAHSGRLTPKIVLNADLVDNKLNGDLVENNSKTESHRNTRKNYVGVTKVKGFKKEPKMLHCKISNNVNERVDKTEDNVNDDNKQLKGLLLLHLDLIHHQQELLLSKERVISSLRAEKNTLKCRLDRMERRMYLAKHKTSISKETKDTKDPKENDSDICSSVPSVTKLSINKGSKRRSSLEPKNLSKRFAAAETNLQSGKLHLLQEPKRGNTPTRQAKKDASEVRISHRSRRLPTEKEQTSSRPQFITEPKEDVKKEPKQIESVGDNMILRTSSMYYSIPYREVEPPDEEVGDRIKNVLSVEVPTWRLNPVQNRYVIEGTENLEDEIFMKRHQKPEMDEKRRKRWDLQRSREQALYERLKQGYRCGSIPGTVRERDDNISSFFPDPDEIGFIEVADKIPVTAFGYPIPDLSCIDFDIPWLEMYKKEERHKPGRGRRR